MKKIKNIVFDLGGVLLDLDRQAAVDKFIELGYSQADDLLDPYRQKGIFLQLEKGEVTPEELYEYIQRQTDVPISPEQINEALCKFLVGLPEYKLDMLRELKQDYNIYMLSNTNAIMFPYVAKTYFTQQGLGLEDYFDRTFLSYEMDCVKPDEKIYTKMLSEGGFKAQESLFIDDASANIAIAKELGFYTYLAKPKEDFRKIFKQYSSMK